MDTEINFEDPFLFALLVKGNSLFPEVRSGDYAVLTPASKIVPGSVYAVFIKGTKYPLLREIYQTDANYKLVSPDSHDKPVTISRDDLLAYYRLINIYRSFA